MSSATSSNMICVCGSLSCVNSMSIMVNRKERHTSAAILQETEPVTGNLIHCRQLASDLLTGHAVHYR